MWNFNITISHFSLIKCYTSVKRITCACQSSHIYVKVHIAMCQLNHMTRVKYSTSQLIKTNNSCEQASHTSLLNFWLRNVNSNKEVCHYGCMIM
jgi:hypothetical protein